MLGFWLLRFGTEEEGDGDACPGCPFRYIHVTHVSRLLLTHHIDPVWAVAES